MKKIVAVLCGLLTLPAFAEIVPDWYEQSEQQNQVEYADDSGAFLDQDQIQSDEEVSAEQAAQAAPAVVKVRTGNVQNISRSVTHVAPSNASRAVPSRSISSRTVSNRSTSNTGSQLTQRAPVSAGSRSGGSSDSSVSTRRTTASSANSARAGLLQSDTVNTPLYTSSSSARVSVRPTTSIARAPTVRAATTTTTTVTDAATTASNMEQTAQMTDFCKAQYYSCMDNFCAVLDDNQGRCSCSSNVKNYQKTEEALKSATEELQDVAQQIQYIGLGQEDVETLFTQTEAEQTMAGRTDTTQLRTDLDNIKKLIVDIKAPNATSSAESNGIDLTALFSTDFSGGSFDLATLFGDSSSTSVSNQRGAELYKTASARCKTSVIDNCKTQGVDVNIITNGYDLEIDKQCIAYERSLDDANTNMRRTVRNATAVLQKARLAVAQQKNSYDLRGCINALDSCMQDEFVCGSDYENCLDPTGTFIVNGEVVVGSRPGKPLDGTVTTVPTTGLYKVWNYSSNVSNPWVDTRGTLSQLISTDIGAATNDTNRMVGYIQDKIGYNLNGRNYGMCVSVLNKCQDVSYNATTKTYDKANKAIDGYLQRTLVLIKAKQDEVLSDYAENCINDVRTCLVTNGAIQGYSTDVAGSVKTAAISACSSQLSTCSSVTGQSDNNSIIRSALCYGNTVYTPNANGGTCS